MIWDRLDLINLTIRIKEGVQPSLSRVNLKIIVQGKGTVDGEAFRHLSPLTMRAILDRLPLMGRANKFQDQFVYMTSDIVVGVEKGRNSFQRSDIAFLASNGAVCFFLKDCKVGRPINPIGEVTSGMEILDSLGPGDVMTVELVQPDIKP